MSDRNYKGGVRSEVDADRAQSLYGQRQSLKETDGNRTIHITIAGSGMLELMDL
jgi:hypothetical protein